MKQTDAVDWAINLAYHPPPLLFRERRRRAVLWQ